MALIHINTQTTTATLPILKMSANARPNTPVTLYNGHSAAIFVGDASCATSGATIGRTIANATSQTFYLSANDVLYGISAANAAAGSVVFTYSA